MAERALFLGLATRPPPCPGLPRGRCVMHGGDKESQRRGTERGGEGRMEQGGDGEGKLTGGHPSNLLSIFPPPVETQRDGLNAAGIKPKLNNFL